MARTRYHVETTNRDGEKVRVTGTPLLRDAARELAAERRSQVPAGSSALFEMHETKRGKR